MPKRKRHHDDREESEPSKRRRRSVQCDAGDLCQELYDTIRNHKGDDGRLLCESFIRAPKRRNSADYYDVVTTPIDLLKIQQKLKTDEYEDLEHLTHDFELMIGNAKSYYKKSSQEYKDACQLWDLFLSSKVDLLNSLPGKVKDDSDNDVSESSSGAQSSEVLQQHGSLSRTPGLSCNPSNFEEDNPLEELFAAVMTATDLDGRVFSTSVQLLPSRRLNPEYYKIIQEPMDLKMIASNIQNNKYRNISELEQDLLLIIKNVKTCNAPGSQMYKDAVALRRVIATKKLEIEHGRATGSKTSERIRLRRLAGGQRLSAITAALQYESDGEEMQAEDEAGEEDDAASDTKDSNNPQWQMFDAVREHQSPQGYSLSEPFLRLPSRRVYPDYYKEIKHPISLLNIRAKIKNGSYATVTDVVDDVNTMLENAKQYNRADSKIYKDAAKLHKFVQARAREMINLEKENESEEDDNLDEKLKRRTARKLFASSGDERKKTNRKTDGELGLKKRMKLLYRTLLDFSDEAGRPLITLFMEKPSKKNYPDYYQVIAEPIDMKTIDSNIKNDKYESEEALISDFNLMFRNCRQYNEEDSQIYRDADTLEKVLLDKVQEMVVDSPKLKIIAKKSKVKASPQMTQKLRTLFEAIRDYSDKGRRLSVIFAKLPSRAEYPDYYEVIKRPVDIQKIQSRLNGGHYESLEDMLSDFVLMFDNACKYNEPDSQIYKDALTLQRVALQTKMELSEDEDGSIPDVRPLVQDLLTSLFTYVYNHQDEEGRCFSDSLAELSESRAADQEAARILTLDMIKRNLDKGRYRRLDAFQDDMFDVFETARRVSRTDSQVFEDSMELQSYFIKMRDELSKNGDVLSSPALRYTERDMQQNVENLKIEKLPKERSDDEREKEQDNRAEKEQRSSQNNSDCVNFREQTYHVGDFVYIEPREKGLEAHIIHIEKLWKDELGEQWIYGCWFYRPNETFHLATRKFLEKEVFKSDNYNSAPMNQVLGKCYVMFVKDYFKFKPEGFLDKDIYVCESRYSAKAKAFKKIKIWPIVTSQYIRLVPRDVLFISVRVPSVFKERPERMKEDSMDVDEFVSKISEREKPNVLVSGAAVDENGTYYEQYNIPTGRFKLGDCVYVRSENGRQLIARIDKMWEDKAKGSYFHGPWFVTPQEITHPPTRLFHKQEVFLSSIEDTNPLLSITGRCHVMELKDYVRCRPTEIAEQDVFVCESRYLEAERQIRKLNKGLKKFVLSPAVSEDEIYFFKKPISTQKTEHNNGCQPQLSKAKAQTSSEPSPLLPKVSDAEMEDSNDGQAPSIGSNDAATPSQTPVAKKKPIRRLVTGYILYAGEVRKSIIQQNPDCSFGDISRMVGTEWRSLPADQKADYEERAQKLNEETAANQPQSDPTQSPMLPENTVYECQWEKCMTQFEDLQDMTDHLIGETNGHIAQKYSGTPADNGEFQCLWYNCSRVKKNMAPFQNMQRLTRHCKDVHIKSSGKNVPPPDRGKNFVPSQRNPQSAGNRPLTPGGQRVQTYSLPRFPHQQGYPSMSGLSTPPLHPGIPQHLQFSSVAGTKTKSKGSKEPPDKTMTSKDRLDKQKSKKKGHGVGGPGSAKPADPMFVAVPPKPQKLLHSEAYLRYIEGLQPDNRTISSWDHNLKATQENTPLYDSGRLPIQWLGNGAGNHGNAVNALWALRDYMMKDALNIAKIM